MDCRKHNHEYEIIINKPEYKRVERKLEVKIPTEWGEFNVFAYRGIDHDDDAHTHLALTMGDISTNASPAMF